MNKHLYNLSVILFYRSIMKAIARTRTVGGSLVITIPVELVREQSIKENELVEVEVKKTKRDFFGALRGIGHFTEEDELQGQLR